MLQRGTIVAGYRIDEVLGEGGMGAVYRATQLSLNRVVALKVLTGELASDAGFRARFQREGQLQAGLDHDHIVTVHEAGQIEDGLFIAMRLIDGPTLKDLIRAKELDARRTLRLLAQVAQALDVAHETGLIHRDIKPQNILIGRGDHAYLADFGLTKAPDDSARLTSTGQFVGTIDYVAPEQVQGLPATAATDCYSLTAVLYECLTGEVPFVRADETGTLRAHLIEPPPRISERRPDLPKDLDEVIARGMAKDPASRTSSARELITAATRAVAAGSALGPGQETRLSGTPARENGGQLTRAGGAATMASPAPGPGPAGGATRRAVTPATAQAAAVGAGEAAVPERAPRSARALPYAALLLLAAVAIVVGVLVGRSGSKTSSSSFGSSAAIGHLQLHYPGSWQLSGSSAAVPGMNFNSPIVLTANRAGGELVAGEVADAAGPTLLAPSFRSRIKTLPSPRAVTLGPLQTYSYPGLHVTGLASPATVYAAPTSAGVATLICWGSGAGASTFSKQCSQVAATLRLVGVTSYPLGPISSYARLVSKTFSTLRSATSGPLSQLRAASTPTAQATAARQLAGAYTTAASSLRAATVSPMVRNAHDAVIAALEQIARGYTNAASAASAGASRAYGTAGRTISSGSAALSAALRQLASLGYNVGG